MENTGPIEIRPEDIIKRPETLPAVSSPETTKQPGILDYLRQLREGMKQFNEVKGQLKEMGIELPGLKIPGGKQNPEPPPDTGGAFSTVARVLQFLRGQYGDITLSELGTRLKADYGTTRLSEILKGTKPWLQ